MTYESFCNSCRDLFNKKLYSKDVLSTFVQKGALATTEYDAIITGNPFLWEMPVENTKEEIQNA